MDFFRHHAHDLPQETAILPQLPLCPNRHGPMSPVDQPVSVLRSARRWELSQYRCEECGAFATFTVPCVEGK